MVRSPVPKCKAFGWTSRANRKASCHPPPAPRRNGLCSIPIFLFKKSVIHAVIPPFSQKASHG